MDLWQERDATRDREERRRWQQHHGSHRYDSTEHLEEWERNFPRRGLEFGTRAKVGGQRVSAIKATEL